MLSYGWIDVSRGIPSYPTIDVAIVLENHSFVIVAPKGGPQLRVADFRCFGTQARIIGSMDELDGYAFQPLHILIRVE